MIIIGGLTRLTNSGLSITEWELFTGILPPLSYSKWQEYFNLYKNIPQFQLINPDMSIEEFKIIFYWEYFHRVLGRIIGLVFIIPLLVFHYRNKIDSKKILTLYTIAILIILQGIVGWYMVKSGLVNDVTVSHYRLSIHLSLAVIIISILFWQIKNYSNDKIVLFYNSSKANLPYLFLIILIFFTSYSWSICIWFRCRKSLSNMASYGLELCSDDFLIENIKNFFDFDDHSLVQFYHRNMAYFISIYIFILIFFTLKKKIKIYINPR